MTETQKSKIESKSCLTHTHTQRNDMDDMRTAMVEADVDGKTEAVPRGAASYREESAVVLPKGKRHRYRAPNQKINILSE